MRIKIIDAVVKSSDRLRTSDRYIRDSLRPDTEIEYAHISKGFPSVECDLHAAFNKPQIALMTREYTNVGKCCPSPYLAVMFRQ